MKILTRESLLIGSCVLVLTMVFAVVQWRMEGRVDAAVVTRSLDLGVRFGVTAYVLAAIVRLMLRATSKFKKWA